METKSRRIKMGGSVYAGSLTVLLLYLIAPNVAAQESHARPLAQKITADNAAELIKQGPDAIGGIGDWHLSNGTLCAVVSAIEHEHEFSARGGSLVDLGYCDRADDHYSFSQDLLDGDRRKPLNGDSVTLAHDAGSASVLVTLSAPGVVMQTRYKLDLEHPQQLKISKRLRVVDEDLADMNLLSLGSFNYHSLEPFVFAAHEPRHSVGFANVDFVSRGVSAMSEAAHDADTIITLSPADAAAPISYGWQLRKAERIKGDEITTLPRFVLADEESIAMLVLADSFWIGDGRSLGWLQLAQVPLLSVDAESELHFEEVIHVGAEASVASVTDQLISNAAPITGAVTDAPAAVHLRRADGIAFSHARVGADGRFSINAPAGEYVLRVRGSGDRATELNIDHGTQRSDVGQLALPDIARIQLPQGQPMRLVFVGLEATINPHFADNLTDFSVRSDEGIEPYKRMAQVFLAGVESDRKFVEVPSGKYRVYATRGPEFSLEQTELQVQAGKTYKLNIEVPQRQLDTPGRISADLHVHAGDSFDNTFDNYERVRTFVAEHGEVMVNSEHDVMVDFAPYIETLGVGDKVATILGAEMTSLLLTEAMPFSGGHMNFFPATRKPHEYRKGMLAHENRRLREIMHDIQQQHPDALTQLNHPRRNLSLSFGAPDDYAALIDNGNYLEHMGVAAFPYNPALPLTAEHNKTLIDKHPKTGLRDLDFDAMEIINPGGADHDDRITAARRDWLSFLLQGERITGTANSDSHRATEQVAVPRNMVAVTHDSVTEYSIEELVQSLKSGNTYGTTGPMLNIDLDGALMGQTLRAKSATLNLDVFAADWIPVERVEVQVNGQTVQTLSAKDNLSWEVPLNFEDDAFVTVEVFGQADEHYAHVYPEINPYAFSNPIYVDADGDGKITITADLKSL